jgi:hypothetical protein
VYLPSEAFALQTALPIGTVSCSWAISGEATAQAALDDPIGSPDDLTTHINEVTQGDTCRVNVASIDDPENNVNHVIRFRATATGSGAAEKMTVQLFEGATERATSPNISITRTSWNNYSYTLSSTEADSITAYTDLRLQVTAATLGSETLRVTQIYLETDDAPSGTTHNITVSELNEGSDSHSIIKTIPIAVSESNEGSDTSNVQNAGTVHNIIVSEINEGSDSHGFIMTRQINLSEINEGADSSVVQVQGTTHDIIVSESVDGSDSSTIGIQEGFSPGGKYIWIKVAAPTTDRLGGVFAFDCGAGFYVQGITSTGSLICTALP